MEQESVADAERGEAGKERSRSRIHFLHGVTVTFVPSLLASTISQLHAATTTKMLFRILLSDCLLTRLTRPKP